MKKNIPAIIIACLLSSAIAYPSNNARCEKRSSWPIKIISPWKFIVTILLLQSTHAIDPETPFACASTKEYIYDTTDYGLYKFNTHFHRAFETICKHPQGLYLRKPNVDFFPSSYDLLPHRAQKLCITPNKTTQTFRGEWVAMDKNFYRITKHTLQCATQGLDEDPKKILEQLF